VNPCCSSFSKSSVQRACRRKLSDAAMDAAARSFKVRNDSPPQLATCHAHNAPQTDRGRHCAFKASLRGLLLVRPFKGCRVVALDPGFRNGVKCAVLSEEGALLAHVTIFPHTGQVSAVVRGPATLQSSVMIRSSDCLSHPRQAERSVSVLLGLASQHRASLFAVGNGVASRETCTFLAQSVLPKVQGGGGRFTVVSEAGASVYSVSKAAQVTPDAVVCSF